MAGIGGGSWFFVDRHRERRDISTPHHRRCLRRGGLDVLRIVVTTVDDHQIRDSAGDVDLPVEIGSQIAGAQPAAVGHRALRVAAFAQPRLKFGAEGQRSFFGLPPVAPADVVALQPHLADRPVG